MSEIKVDYINYQKIEQERWLSELKQRAENAKAKNLPKFLINGSDILRITASFNMDIPIVLQPVATRLNLLVEPANYLNLNKDALEVRAEHLAHTAQQFALEFSSYLEVNTDIQISKNN